MKSHQFKFFSNTISLSFVLGCLLSFNAFRTNAESYAGIQAGMSFGSKVSGTKVDVNPNYQDSLLLPPFYPPAITEPIRAARFTGADMTDSKLDESFAIGAKVGHYFDAISFLGVEGEINYTKPDFKTQNLTVSGLNNNILGISNGQATKQQLSADIHDFSGTASLMFRYPVFKRVTPYIGVGPTFHYIRLRGTGSVEMDRDGNPLTPNELISAPALKDDKLSLGLQAKTGIRFNLTKHLSADIEYKYNFCPVRLEQFRDLNNYRGQYNSHQLGAALVYRFGKINW